jgi:hypothetical protein
MPRESRNKLSMYNPTKPPINTITLNRPTLFQSVKDGFGFSIGATIARNLVTPIFSPEKIQQDIRDNLVKNNEKKQEFKQCMEKTQNYDECVHYLE